MFYCAFPCALVKSWVSKFHVNLQVSMKSFISECFCFIFLFFMVLQRVYYIFFFNYPLLPAVIIFFTIVLQNVCSSL